MHKASARIKIHSAPTEVFAAFAEAERMSRFWFMRRDDGLRQGEKCTWYLGKSEDAYAFDISVSHLSEPDSMVFEWPGPDGNITSVRWSFEDDGGGSTILSVEETGFSGSDEEIAAKVLDSQGGFNQVVVAAKAYLEHGVAVNIVDDHA
jgi:uncharacterized protein YndB with AHSA1/START domain